MKKHLVRNHQRGSVIVETALSAVLFFGLVLGVVEFGRLGYTYATAVEATRLGARIAVVCGSGANAVIKTRMIALVPQLSASDITISPPAAGGPVTVSINAGVSVHLSIPLGAINAPLPAFSTSLMPEFMATATPSGVANAICF